MTEEEHDKIPFLTYGSHVKGGPIVDSLGIRVCSSREQGGHDVSFVSERPINARMQNSEAFIVSEAKFDILLEYPIDRPAMTDIDRIGDPMPVDEAVCTARKACDPFVEMLQGGAISSLKGSDHRIISIVIVQRVTFPPGGRRRVSG